MKRTKGGALNAKRGRGGGSGICPNSSWHLEEQKKRGADGCRHTGRVKIA